MKTLILTLLITFTLASCGSKDDKKNRNQIGQLGNNSIPTRQTQVAQPQPPREDKELFAETSEELYYSLKASGVDMQRVQDGEQVLIKCDDSSILNEMSMAGCRLGFNERELQTGGAGGPGTRMTKGHSEDLHDSIYTPQLRDALMGGTILTISCKKTCEITDGYQGERQMVDHRSRGYRQTPTGGF